MTQISGSFALELDLDRLADDLADRVADRLQRRPRHEGPLAAPDFQPGEHDRDADLGPGQHGTGRPWGGARQGPRDEDPDDEDPARWRRVVTRPLPTLRVAMVVVLVLLAAAGGAQLLAETWSVRAWLFGGQVTAAVVLAALALLYPLAGLLLPLRRCRG